MEKLITIKQLSELLQISSSTIYEWTHTGFIPYYKLPKGVRFRETEIVEWLKKRQSKGRISYRIKVS